MCSEHYSERAVSALGDSVTEIIRHSERSAAKRLSDLFAGAYPIPKSEEDSSGVPQTRQITAEQSPQISGSVTSRAHLGQ